MGEELTIKFQGAIFEDEAAVLFPNCSGVHMTLFVCQNSQSCILKRLIVC